MIRAAQSQAESRGAPLKPGHLRTEELLAWLVACPKPNIDSTSSSAAILHGDLHKHDHSILVERHSPFWTEINRTSFWTLVHLTQFIMVRLRYSTDRQILFDVR